MRGCSLERHGALLWMKSFQESALTISLHRSVPEFKTPTMVDVNRKACLDCSPCGAAPVVCKTFGRATTWDPRDIRGCQSAEVTFMALTVIP